jgi:hypothetical protein
MEIELLKSKEQSESASKAKTDFLHMSHEIRTRHCIGYSFVDEVN